MGKDNNVPPKVTDMQQYRREKQLQADLADNSVLPPRFLETARSVWNALTKRGKAAAVVGGGLAITAVFGLGAQAGAAFDRATHPMVGPEAPICLPETTKPVKDTISQEGERRLVELVGVARQDGVTIGNPTATDIDNYKVANMGRSTPGSVTLGKICVVAAAGSPRIDLTPQP